MPTITKKTSDTVRGHLEKYEECIQKATNLLWLMVALSVVAAGVEILIYMPIISSKLYGSDQTSNNLISAVLSATPVLIALVMALVVDRLRVAKRGKILLILLLIALFAVEVAYFFWAWNLRAETIDDETFANVLNLVAVMVTIGTLIAHLIWSKARSLLLKRADIYALHATYNKTERGLTPFQHTSSTDTTRRTQCFGSFKAAFEEVVENVLKNLSLSRLACAKLLAKTDAQARGAMELPLCIQGQTYTNPQETKKVISAYISAPKPADYHRIFGADINDPLDKRARRTVEEMRARYNEIIRRHAGTDI